MLGTAIAAAMPVPQRWMQQLWGLSEIHARQKWSAIEPYLSALPGGLRLLDAGCGEGKWTLELAARHPTWQVQGVDMDETCIASANTLRATLGLANASFVLEDFLSFAPRECFDVVLSVASAHYLVENGDGQTLFKRFASWLAPGGTLMLLGPRVEHEVPMVPFLPSLATHTVFTRVMLEELCAGARLHVRTLRPAVGRCGTVAKQLAEFDGFLWPVSIATFPLQLALTHLDEKCSTGAERSAFWLLVAKKEEG